jgi:hypothetical protein
MQTNRCAVLHASMEAQRAMLLRECGAQARLLARADAHVSASGHLPLRHRPRSAPTVGHDTPTFRTPEHEPADPGGVEFAEPPRARRMKRISP